MVFCTAYATPTFSRHALSMGVAHVYEKPMHLEDLSNLIQEAIDDEKI
jgi:DNA-binding NtrC family response regulator